MKTRTYMRLTNTTSAPAIKFIPCFHLHFDEIFSCKIVFLNVFLMTSSATSLVVGTLWPLWASHGTLPLPLG